MDKQQAVYENCTECGSKFLTAHGPSKCISCYLDKQQAARVAFEAWVLYHKATQNIAHAPNGYKDWEVEWLWRAWQAAQAALMPTLVEARDALERISICRQDSGSLTTTDLLNGCVSLSRQTLARINSVIGDKK